MVANRVKVQLEKIINSDQSAFLKGRDLSDTIRKVVDTVRYADRKNLNFLLLLLDFEKAFDRVNYNSLARAMKLLNFGEKIVECVGTLYKDFALCTINNGHFSEFFTPTRGLFQGNPFSCYGFIIIIEILAMMIRKEKNIKGIKIGNMTSLLAMFADDLSLFIQNDEKTWRAVHEVIKNFESISGLKVNYEKSTVYRIGSARHSNAKYYSMKRINWAKDEIEVLGVIIVKDDEQMVEKNVQPLLEKASQILKVWQMRALSLLGKVLICNTLIASLFIHRLTVIPSLTKDIIKKYNQIISNFIWDGGKPKISLEILQGNKQDGGLGLTNIAIRDKALKVKWVGKILQNECISILAYEAMGNDIGNLIWHCSLREEEVIQVVQKQCNKFWIDVWKAWCKLTYIILTNFKEIESQTIWLNSCIRINNKPLKWKNWISLGIITLGDLLNENKEIIKFESLNERCQDKLPFTEFYGIIKALPQLWKNILKEKSQKEPVKTNWVELSTQKILSSKIAYAKMNMNEVLLRKIEEKWTNGNPKFETGLPELKSAIANIYKITNYVKMRSFQYRFITKSIITNIHLSKMKIKNDNRCTFCDIEKETMKHLFWNCQVIQRFWEEVEETFKSIGAMNFSKIVYNNIVVNPKMVENAIVLAAKMFIYSERCNYSKPKIQKFKEIIKQLKEIEKEIAYRNGNQTLHKLKWENIKL